MEMRKGVLVRVGLGWGLVEQVRVWVFGWGGRGCSWQREVGWVM